VANRDPIIVKEKPKSDVTPTLPIRPWHNRVPNRSTIDIDAITAANRNYQMWPVSNLLILKKDRACHLMLC